MITSPRRRNLKGFIIRLQHPTIHAGKRKYTVKVLHISPQTTPDPSPCHPLLTGRFASWHVPSLLHDLLSHRLTYLLANVALKRAENTKRKNKKKNQALGGAAKLYDSQRTCQSNERTEPWLSFNNTTSNNFCHRSLFLQSSSTLKPVSDIGWRVPRRGVVPMRLCFYSTSERPLVKCCLQPRKLFDSLFFFFSSKLCIGLTSNGEDFKSSSVRASANLAPPPGGLWWGAMGTGGWLQVRDFQWNMAHWMEKCHTVVCTRDVQ